MSDKKNPFHAGEDKYDPTIPTATLQIYQAIERAIQESESTTVNRASAATMCVKRRWYQRIGTPGTPLTPRKKVNFFLGDLAEKVLIYFIKEGCVGEGRLYSEVDFGAPSGSFDFNTKRVDFFTQKEWTSNIGGLQVTGHPDGIGKRNSDGKWELIEIKSAANFGFKDFKEKGAGDYLRQAHALMLSEEAKKLDINEVRFFYLAKETGHLYDRLHHFDENIASKVTEEFIIAQGEREPSTPFPLVDEKTGRGKFKSKTGRKVAGFPCTYCPFLEQCHGKFTVEWEKNMWGSLKPKYVVRGKQ